MHTLIILCTVLKECVKYMYVKFYANGTAVDTNNYSSQATALRVDHTSEELIFNVYSHY